jgi:hypothetical protein
MRRLKFIWNALPDSAKRAVHTFYQTFAAMFLLGLGDVFDAFQGHGLAAGKSALLALVGAAFAASISALKSTIIDVKKR